ncbi:MULTISPECIES: response regulator transcription factor [Kitasatospora]|uniref:response regulator transcription factor n=1 Tax=Kitasatospora TaxID=2063 RepID=UPI002476E6E4|nr:helix-turn-helix transcriptional regulator [Kitasatospora sp. GP30]MDH6144269.1 DNA-binding CsgD family transcriptional regulator [Kitasatospora sp. GP30]
MDTSSLTARENDVFGLLGIGLSNGEIARQLHISASTVKAHLGRVLAKLGLRTRTSAALAAQLHLLRMCPSGQCSSPH